MQINGLPIPERLVALLASGPSSRYSGSRPLCRAQDHYGNPLETELGQIFQTADKMQRETEALARHYVADGIYGEDLDDLAGPGAILDIINFERIVCFAISGDGSPFCLDYREDPSDPSVIWWDDTYWRKLAPNFEAFLELFNGIA